MLVGASIPSVSVLAVSARSSALGLAHGVAASLGVVVGDIVFILIAIYGLAVLADLMGSNFSLIKYAGGAYLIWLGMMLWRSKSQVEAAEENGASSILSSFMTGLLITLGDQKAILFYLGFFPAFVDVSAVTLLDAGIIVGTAAVAVGGPKLAYAFMADRASLILKRAKVTNAINMIAGGVMVAVGGCLLVRA